MKLQHLKEKRREARLNMNRARHRASLLTSALCRSRGKYLEAKDEYQALDRKIAEQYVVECPKSESKDSKSKRTNGDSINLDDLTADQIAELKLRIEQEIKEVDEEE